MGTTSASGGSACRTVCFFTERGCMDILDMVAVGVSDGNGSNADCLQDLKIRAGCFLKCWQLRLQDFLHGCL